MTHTITHSTLTLHTHTRLCIHTRTREEIGETTVLVARETHSTVEHTRLYSNSSRINSENPTEFRPHWEDQYVLWIWEDEYDPNS
jgi:histidinol phosphatase-like PHP family hydrolase